MRAIILSVFLAIAPVAGWAQGTSVAVGGMQQDPNAPVEVTADSLSIDQTAGLAVYSGDVLVIQGNLRMSAPRITIYYVADEARVDRMEAIGGVTFVSETEAAEAERADYNVSDGVIELTGDVLLTQGPNALTSQKMVVDLETGTAQMTGRVRTVLQQGTDQ